jgi:predicted acylesterase/phospholipase RssA
MAWQISLNIVANKKISAWVGQGGGARFVQELALLERHYNCIGSKTPDFAVGSSAGALLMFCVSRLGFEGTKDFMFSRIRKREDLFGTNWFWGAFSGGVWNSKPLERLAREVMRMRPSAMFPVWACYYDIHKQQKAYSEITDESTIDFLVASASIPLVVEPRRKFLVDGGIVENTPLKFAIDRGADNINVFLASAKEIVQPPHRDNRYSKIATALRCFEAMRLEMAEDDLKVCSMKNTYGSKRKI